MAISKKGKPTINEVASIAFQNCFAINQANPMAVAESIKEMYEMLKILYVERINIGENKPFWTPGNRERIEQVLSKVQSKDI